MDTITKMRRRIVPVKLEDRIAASFMIAMIPVYYYFEFFVVLPDVYHQNLTSYWGNLVAGHFIALNIIGNYACMLISDTSAHAHRQDVKKVENSIQQSPGCKLCDEDFRPPLLTWHCVSCGTCILKRDHHCIFLGYCIGQYNRRFFIVFLIYMAIGTTYYFYCTTKFLLKRIDIYIPTLLADVFCPPLIIFFRPKSALYTAYFILYVLLIIAMIMVCLLCLFNAYLITRGMVGIEMKIGRKKRGKSTLIENIKEVLGTRWYLTWVCPLISSHLPLETNSSL